MDIRELTIQRDAAIIIMNEKKKEVDELSEKIMKLRGPYLSSNKYGSLCLTNGGLTHDLYGKFEKEIIKDLISKLIIGDITDQWVKIYSYNGRDTYDFIYVRSVNGKYEVQVDISFRYELYSDVEKLRFIELLSSALCV